MLRLKCFKTFYQDNNTLEFLSLPTSLLRLQLSHFFYKTRFWLNACGEHTHKHSQKKDRQKSASDDVPSIIRESRLGWVVNLVKILPFLPHLLLTTSCSSPLIGARRPRLKLPQKKRGEKW